MSVSEVIDYLRITGQFDPVLHALLERKKEVHAARKEGITVSPEVLQKAADTYRYMMGLFSSSDTQKWLDFYGLSEEALENFLEASLLIDEYKKGHPKRLENNE